MLRTNELEYDLPESLIATHAAEPRDSARLMVVWRSDPNRVEHARVRDLPRFLLPSDLLVRNTTRVAPARFEAFREDSGGRAQGLVLGPVTTPDPTGESRRDASASPELFGVLIKSRRQGPGVRYQMLDRRGSPGGWTLELLERHPDEPGAWVARVLDERGAIASIGRALEGEHDDDPRACGLTPLPPYILRARRRERDAEAHDDRAHADAHDRRRYQTVYAGPCVGRHDDRVPPSVAAPTAGLHFTPELLAALGSLGVSSADVSLSVGTGTFKPVESGAVEAHAMHAEWCAVPVGVGRAILDASSDPSRRVIAVGTTSVRTIESFPTPSELLAGGVRSTTLLITPGFSFRWTRGLLTNFHLPRSTLMAMVGALLSPGARDDGTSEGVARLRGLYELAARERYRFYSFGDAMLILP